MNIPSILDDYLRYILIIQGDSVETVKGYKSDLAMFFRFLIMKENKIDFREIEYINISQIDRKFIKKITLNDIYSFLEYVEKYKHNETSARARKVSALKSFFKYILVKKHIIKDDPCLLLEAPKIPKRMPIYMSLEESRKLLQNINGRNKKRDFCMITLFLNCGFRLSELTNIKVSDIKGDTVKIKGKGNKERIVYLNSKCLEAINDYIPVRNKKDPFKNIEYLFLSEWNRQICNRTVEITLKNYLRKAELDNKYTVHKLRHTAATLMYKYGNVDIRSLQVILGHESVNTTQIYTHVDRQQLRNCMAKNPLNINN